MFNGNKSEKIANKIDFTEYDREAVLAYRAVCLKAEQNLAQVVADRFPEVPKNVQPIGTISLAHRYQQPIAAAPVESAEVRAARELVERAQSQIDNPLIKTYRDAEEAA